MAGALVSVAVTFCSTMAGGLAALRWSRRLEPLMALAGGVVLAAAAFDLLPEAVRRAGHAGLPAFVPFAAAVAGYVAFSALERGANRDGGTHGGVTGAAGFVVHSFFDGLAIGLGFKVGSGVGILVALAVIGHDFSDGLSTVSYLVAHGQPPGRSRRWLVADAAAPMAGALVASLAPVPGAVLPVALGFFSGLFVFAAARNLLPRAWRLPPAHWVPLTGFGALVMFLVSRLA